MADIFIENDTLARIGTSCFQQLLESNVRKLSPEKWESIVSAFIQLFKTTTASQLFDPQLHAEVEPDNMADEADGESCSPALSPFVSNSYSLLVRFMPSSNSPRGRDNRKRDEIVLTPL